MTYAKVVGINKLLQTVGKLIEISFSNIRADFMEFIQIFLLTLVFKIHLFHTKYSSNLLKGSSYTHLTQVDVISIFKFFKFSIVV